MNKPIDNCYWVIPDMLLAGEHPGDDEEDRARKKLRRFLVAGVSQFIDLTEKGECPEYESVLMEEAERLGVEAVYCHHPIRRGAIPRSPVQMAAIIREIGEAAGRGMSTYMHAGDGVGRTGLAVGCYLVECGLSGERALRKLAILYSAMEMSAWEPYIPKTAQQMEYVANWQPGAGES